MLARARPRIDERIGVTRSVAVQRSPLCALPNLADERLCRGPELEGRTDLERNLGGRLRLLAQRARLLNASAISFKDSP